MNGFLWISSDNTASWQKWEAWRNPVGRCHLACQHVSFDCFCNLVLAMDFERTIMSTCSACTLSSHLHQSANAIANRSVLVNHNKKMQKEFPSITNKMQLYIIYLFLWNALHDSGGSSAHHQELKTVYTASGTAVKVWQSTRCCTWFIPKVRVLIFYLNVYWTHLKLQVISFNVWPLGS